MEKMKENVRFWEDRGQGVYETRIFIKKIMLIIILRFKNVIMYINLIYFVGQ